MSRTTFAATFVVCLGLSSGCAKYQAMSLEPLKPEFHASALSKDGVFACCEIFDGVACKRYFGKDLIKRGVQPIQVSVANNSSRTLMFDLSRCSLPCLPPDQVAKRAHFSTAGRATGYGVAGLFIWPLLVPAIVDGCGSSKANTQMDHDYASKGVKDQLIRPYDVSNGVFFVPVEQMSPNLAVHLVDREAGGMFKFSWRQGVPVGVEYESFGGSASSAIVESEVDRSANTGGGDDVH